MTFEGLSKLVARSVVRPLVPDSFYARTVQLWYLLFRRGGHEAEDFGAFLADPRLDPVLVDMLRCYLGHGPESRASRHWVAQNEKHLAVLAEGGFGRFKETLALNYFTAVDTTIGFQEAFLVRQLSAEAVKEARQLAEAAPVHPSVGPGLSRRFNCLTYLLWAFVRREVGETWCALSEPALGRPLAVDLEGRPVTQDLANSLLELRAFTPADGSLGSVLEIGAGYGRTAFAALKLNPGIRYTIADIPPALYVSQRYLSEVLPGLPVFRFRDFASFEEVREEMMSSRLVFLMPEQLKLLPDKLFDQFVAIDCLHEMRPDQIGHYFELADRLARRVYFTCRSVTTVAFENIVLSEGDYTVPPHWERIFWRQRAVHTDYFEALLRTGPEES